MSGPHDPYVDPETGVLFNELGIDSPRELDAAEADLTAVRLAQLGRTPLTGAYDLAHLQAFHAHIFGDVYSWAGALRTVAIDKGVPFCLPEHLVSYAAQVFTRLADDRFLRERGRDDFVAGLAELMADLNALHPFREGNGRTQRAFASQLARDAGHVLRWSDMDPVENVAASRAAVTGDSGPLRQLLGRLVDRPDPGATAPRRPD